MHFPYLYKRAIRLFGSVSFAKIAAYLSSESVGLAIQFMTNPQFARKVAAIAGFSAVAFGAFGAHMLRSYLNGLGTTQIWQTGVLYHLVHAIALLVLSGWRPVPKWSFWCILAGVTIFSGSLYLLALTNFRWFGALTPLGGFGMLAGWLALCLKTSEA
jgi:uncharacterized membrane protein YgdD (TMEM256/DUF423 family)